MKLHEYMNPNWIALGLKANDKFDAIHMVFEKIDFCLKSGSDSEKVYQEIIEREKLMSTGIGEGVAIPHAKSDECADFVFNVGIMDGGIDFGSIDGLPVKILCLLVGPMEQPNKHIKLLSRLSKLLNKRAFRDELYQSRTAREIFDIFVKYEQELP